MKPQARSLAEAGPALTIGEDAFLVGGNDAEFRELAQSLMLLSQRALEIREHIAGRLGITGAQYTVLATIRRLQGERGVRVGALADELGVRMPTTTFAVARLAAAGLVDKHPHETDRRGKLIRLSARGETAFSEISGFLQDLNDRCFAGLDRAAFLALRASLGRLEKNFAAALETIAGTAVPDGSCRN